MVWRLVRPSGRWLIFRFRSLQVYIKTLSWRKNFQPWRSETHCICEWHHWLIQRREMFFFSWNSWVRKPVRGDEESLTFKIVTWITRSHTGSIYSGLFETIQFNLKFFMLEIMINDDDVYDKKCNLNNLNIFLYKFFHLKLMLVWKRKPSPILICPNHKIYTREGILVCCSFSFFCLFRFLLLPLTHMNIYIELI